MKELSFCPTPGSEWREEEGYYVMGCGAGEGARVFLDSGLIDRLRQADCSWLSVDVKSRQTWSLVFQFEIWEMGNREEEPDLTVLMSMIPGERVRLLLPFTALDAQHIFLDRTSGKLRSFVTGRAVRPERIGRMAIGLREGWKAQEMEIHTIMTGSEDVTFPFEGKRLVDELGQKKNADWPGKCRDAQEMRQRVLEEEAALDRLPANPQRSSYGGWSALRFPATGFFRLEKTQTRWWLVDPEGCAFLTAGMDCVGLMAATPTAGLEDCYDWLPDKDGEFADSRIRLPWGPEDAEHPLCFSIANLIRCFGKDWRARWEKLTTARLRSWGFNTIGAFSDEDYVSKCGMPYTRSLHNYPSTVKKIYRDFPDVFSTEYRDNSEQYAQQLEEFLTDANMIGYYMRNEPEWAFARDACLAEELLADGESSDTRRELFGFLRNRYDGIDELNRAWNTSFESFEDMEGRRVERGRELSDTAAQDLKDFSRIMISEYVRIPAQALKRKDPNHLNLGMRYAFILYPEQTAGCEFMDVFSINCYKIDPSAVIRKVADLVHMPVMIGEYHFGALDRGLDATGIIGVASQEERAKAYRYYMNHALHEPECVGVQYFELYDQAYLGRPDGENYQIGFLDVCGLPYEEMCRAAILTHEHMYAVAQGEEDYRTQEPERIVSNIAS